MIDRIKLWWWRRGMHPDCVANQLAIWIDPEDVVSLAACTRCYPRMVKIRDHYHPIARAL